MLNLRKFYDFTNISFLNYAVFLVSTNGSLEWVSTNKLQKAVDEQKY